MRSHPLICYVLDILTFGCERSYSWIFTTNSGESLGIVSVCVCVRSSLASVKIARKVISTTCNR